MSHQIELFEFKTGDDTWRYTSQSEDIVVAGHVWAASPMQRSAVAQSSESARNDVRLSFPIGHAFAMQFLGYGPEQKTTLTLRRNRFDDSDSFYVFWKGAAADCEVSNGVIDIVFQSLMNAVENSGLIARTQKFCRHVVYHDGCNVNKNSFAVVATITAIDLQLSSITCTGLESYPTNYFAGGMIRLPSGVYRYVTRSTSNTLTLWRAAPEIKTALDLAATDVELEVYPGCDGSLNTCHSRFNNLDNNGAFYWIPSFNPYGSSNVF